MDKRRSFWGWGYADHVVDEALIGRMKGMLSMLLGVPPMEPKQPPELEQLNLREPRFALPLDVKEWCKGDTFERASHSYGKSFRDIWRGLHGRFDNPPDYVAYPKNEDDILSLMHFASKEGVALIPFGGGSSVTGGVEPPSDDHYTGVISVDMAHLDKILEIDKTSRCARIQAGIYGPALEAGLKPHGLTMRHYPQSFEFSTLGGWLATRSGGHFATNLTHIDDFVQAMRMVTPNGVMETRRLPGSGAGPAEERLLLGSEGILGIITEAWMRLQDIPTHKANVTVRFPDFKSGAAAARAVAQSGLYPSNARLVDPVEAMSTGLGDGQAAVLILAFESAVREVTEPLKQCVELCKPFGGEAAEQKTSGDKAAGKWKSAFLQAPYMRDVLMRFGITMETFETAVTWDAFEAFHLGVTQAVNQVFEATDTKGFVTCRFTHIYPDGPAPYYTVATRGYGDDALERWDTIKAAASLAIIDGGGTITHHHAVGRDHRPYYDQQRSDVFAEMLRAAKSSVDPNWTLNPGVLIDRS